MSSLFFGQTSQLNLSAFSIVLCRKGLSCQSFDGNRVSQKFTRPSQIWHLPATRKDFSILSKEQRLAFWLLVKLTWCQSLVNKVMKVRKCRGPSCFIKWKDKGNNYLPEIIGLCNLHLLHPPLQTKETLSLCSKQGSVCINECHVFSIRCDDLF